MLMIEQVNTTRYRQTYDRLDALRWLGSRWVIDNPNLKHSSKALILIEKVQT